MISKSIFSVPDLKLFAWKAVTYPVPLEYDTWSINPFWPGTTLTGGIKSLDIEVPAIANPWLNTIPKFELRVNYFNYYRNNTLSQTYMNGIQHTIDLQWYLTGTRSTF